MRWRSVVLVLVSVALLGLACESDDTNPSPPSVGPSQDPSGVPGTQESPVSACPNQQDTVLNEDLREGEMEADMDGDGDQDVVSVAKDELGTAGCKGFLVVDQGDSVASLPVEDTLEVDFGLPQLVGFGEIDASPGAEALLRVNQGASTSFLAVYSLGLGSLVKLPFVDGPHPDGVLPYGGTISHLDGVDCVDGSVVSTSAAPEGNGYLLTRSFYVPGDGVMEFDDARTEEVSVEIPELETFPEFAGEPFDNCPFT
jgi:hypothetical protein